MTRLLVASFLAIISVAAAMAADLTEEVAAVERIRGVNFKGQVTQKTITRGELRKYLIGQLEKELPVPVADYLRVLDALELIENRSDTLDRLLALYEAQVLAFYDPNSDVYFSLAEAPAGIELNELMTRGVAIHELTHALQDQQWKAGDRLLAMRGNSDAQMAYQAVLEGEAMLVMMGSVVEMMGQTLDDIVKNDVVRSAMAAMADLNTGVPEDVPKFFVESLKFPYLDGINFVITAYRRGGWEAVNALHENPPVSTEEILHPDLYFDRPPAVSRRPSATTPKQNADGRRPKADVIETGGEFTWRFLLGGEAARGWAGDVIRVKNGGSGNFSVRVESEWDSEMDAREFAEAYREFLASRQIDASVTRQKRQVTVSYVTP